MPDLDESPREHKSLTSLFVDPKEATKEAKRLYRLGGARAVQDAGFIVGWRGWLFSALGEAPTDMVLHSICVGGVWPIDGPLCKNKEIGIHIVKSPMSAITSPGSTIFCQVPGIVAGWGSSGFFRRGWTVEYATPIALGQPDDNVSFFQGECLILVTDYHQVGLANAIDRTTLTAKSYNVPVLSNEQLSQEMTDLGS